MRQTAPRKRTLLDAIKWEIEHGRRPYDACRECGLPLFRDRAHDCPDRKR